MKLFREPVLIINAIGSIVALLFAFNVHGVHAGTADAIVAFLTACLIAWSTRPVAPAIFKGVVTMGAALLADFGLDLSAAQVGTITAAVMTVVALMVRAQVTPAADPRPITVGPNAVEVEPSPQARAVRRADAGL